MSFIRTYLPRSLKSLEIVISNKLPFYTDFVLDEVKKLFIAISEKSSYYKFLDSLSFNYDLHYLRKEHFNIYNSFSCINYIIPNMNDVDFLKNIHVLHIPLIYVDVRSFFTYLQRGGLKKLQILISTDSTFYSHFNVLHTDMYANHFINLYRKRPYIRIPFPEHIQSELYDNDICQTFFRELVDLNRPKIGHDLFKKTDICIYSREFLFSFMKLAERGFFKHCHHIDLYVWFLVGEDDSDDLYNLIIDFTKIFNKTYFPNLTSLSFDYVDYIDTLNSKDLWFYFFKSLHEYGGLDVENLTISSYSYHILLALYKAKVCPFQNVTHLQLGKFLR